jgi:hypothetical protein
MLLYRHEKRNALSGRIALMEVTELHLGHRKQQDNALAIMTRCCIPRLMNCVSKTESPMAGPGASRDQTAGANHRATLLTYVLMSASFSGVRLIWSPGGSIRKLGQPLEMSQL